MTCAVMMDCIAGCPVAEAGSCVRGKHREWSEDREVVGSRGLQGLLRQAN